MATKRRRATKRRAPGLSGLVDTFFDVASSMGSAPYAIGGALAMAAHGYTRETKDVDVFVVHEDRAAWQRALRKHGLHVQPVFAGVHYVATMPGETDPDVRLDLLIPADDPEWSAVAAPDEGVILGHSGVSIMPLTLLVIAKFQSDRSKDHGDVDEMYERGMFDPQEVAEVMRYIDPDLTTLFLEKYR